ncbi:hypothetical protein [Roseimaritima ulvae]|uniref:Uncharacterized protein n=1 Tax=Roseimaritima ulvae TaxID=980254 RepID=A0A5B9QSB2_9BACT|nr:hypothetical protein [Roseimaritima ulvae]QEG41997.1 hypothetical protein UC8_40260 [Roseimaritima ulvae]
MNIQPSPPTAITGIAGTQRAAAKSADNDAAAAADAAQQRADKPAGIENGLAHVEKDAAAGDSEADGRQLYEPREHDHPEDGDQAPPQGRHSVSDEDTGNYLDLDA